MEFHRVSRRRPILNITNMVDVMLLLLIFFILTTTFVYRPAITVNLPVSEQVPMARTGTILVSIDRQGHLFLDGAPVGLEELRKTLPERVKAFPDKHVVIEADREVPYGTVVQAVGVAASSGATRLTLPALRKEPGR